MASKKKLTPAREQALKEYNKERRRIQSLVRNAMKRGYIFERGVVPPAVSQLNFNNVPTVTIKAETRKLHEQKPIHFYKQATAVSFETGKIISGVEKRTEERKQSAVVASINRVEKQKELRAVQHLHEYWRDKEKEVRKELGEEPLPEEKTEKDHGDYGVNLPTEEAKATTTDREETDRERAYREELEQAEELGSPYLESEPRLRGQFAQTMTDFAKEQASRDQENLERLGADKEFASRFSTGNVILQNIQQMIDSAMTDGTYKQAGMDLSIELSQQIHQYGKDRIAMAIAQAPQEAIEDAQVALNYNPGDERHDKAIIALRELITGEIPSAEELKQMQDRMDADAYTNDIG